MDSAAKAPILECTRTDFLSIAHRVNFPSPVCGEAADSVPSRQFPDRKLRNFVFLCLCVYYNLRDKLNLIE